MKILLDENIPVLLKTHFDSSFHIYTVGEMNWSGKKNGELLSAMIKEGFDTLITMDQKLVHQQNIRLFDVTFIVLKALNNKIETLLPFIHKLNSLLQKELKEKIVVVD